MAGQVGSGYLDPTRQGLDPTRRSCQFSGPDPIRPDPIRGSTRPGNNSETTLIRILDGLRQCMVKVAEAHLWEIQGAAKAHGDMVVE
jgi:hypothetical protein